MSEHVGFVVIVNELRQHPNADRMKIATFFGNDTCVDLNTKVGDIGIYFPTDLQLSEEFCDQNHLCRKTATGEPDIGYMDRDKRNVTAIRLRGEKSDGIFLPIHCIEYTGVDVKSMTVGTIIDIINGHEICRKYIPRSNKHQGNVIKGNRTRKKKAIPVAPLFNEHADTEQLAYNMNAFKAGDEIEITLKMHGTSQRTGYLPVLKGYKRTLWDKITHKEGTPIYDWGYVTGTRRTICDNSFEGGFYGSNSFRAPHAKFFEGKLHKGEEIFYEVVGFTDTGTPIMGDCANKKLNDKDFIKKYGETTRFSYGCSPSGEIVKYGNDEDGAFALPISVPQSDFYVYRMTMTNEDGDVVEYSPDFMRYRCEQMGAKCVPVMWRGIIPNMPPREEDNNNLTPGDWIKSVAEWYYDGPDPIGKTHIREGVVIRITNRPKFCAYKHKNFAFKCLEGIVKAEASAPDMEEAEELIEEEA